jgi:MoaA/NifB/PqqE/SkfB family radical SAM enzyme
MNVFKAPERLLKLTIEITTLCNLKCAGCPRTTGIEQGSWTDMHMELDLFGRILDHLPRSALVTLHGIGEPTLHPQFNELVAICALPCAC